MALCKAPDAEIAPAGDETLDEPWGLRDDEWRVERSTPEELKSTREGQHVRVPTQPDDPFPCQVAVPKDEAVRDLASLPKLVWVVVSSDEQRIQQPHRDDGHR